MTSKKLSNKIALVTGGNSGIGFATAKLFIQEGAYVYITGRRQTELDSATKELGGPTVVTAIRCDISNLQELDNLYSQIQQQKGRIDILFANAGVSEYAALGQITEAHLEGTLFGVQKALPLMPPGSAIVLNGSMASVMGRSGNSVYAASKAALRSFARCGAVYLKGRNIRVNVVSPGNIPTPIWDGPGEEKIKQIVETAGKEAPLGRVGTVEEIAKSVLFLSCDDSSYITGAELFVDGGFAQI